MEELLAERIIQLDNLYSIAKSIRFKALILSQMLHLAKAIDPDFLKGEKITTETYYGETEEYVGLRIAECIVRMAYVNEKAYFSESHHISDVSPALAHTIAIMDSIRTKILTMLIEKGLIKHFREIPIAVAEKEEVEEYE